MQDPRALGIVGWSGSGKTALLTRLIPLLAHRGLRIATLKHAHHDFDVDIPGKDSYEHRKAGAMQVIVSSARRWVHMHELDGAAEPTLGELLHRLTPCDLVLIEGFKGEGHPKLEVYRAALGKAALFPGDSRVLAVATDSPVTAPHPQVVDLNDTAAVADCVLAHALPLSAFSQNLIRR